MFRSVQVAEPLQFLVVRLFRLFGPAVFVLLWIFPAARKEWLGYLPLAVGTGLGVLLWTQFRGSPSPLTQRLAGLSRTRFFCFLLLIPLLIQVVLILAVRSEPRLDALAVLEDARSLAETGEMNPITYFAPMQTWWYAFFFRLFGASALVAQLSQVALTLLLILTTYGWVAAGGDRTAARGSALLVALYPGILSHVLMTPNFIYIYAILVLITAVGWLGSRAAVKWQTHAVLGGLGAGLAALTRVVFLTAPIQAFIFYAVSAGGLVKRLFWLKWLMFMLGSVLVLSPWVARNVNVFGRPVWICSSTGLVLYSANNPFSNGLQSRVPDVFKVSSPQAMLEHSRRCLGMTVRFIQKYPRQFIRLAGIKLLHTWGDETASIRDINIRGRPAPRFESMLGFVIQSGWAFLVVLWMLRAGQLLNRRQSPSPLELVVALLVLGEAVVHSVLPGGGQYHLSSVPLLAAYVFSGDQREE